MPSITHIEVEQRSAICDGPLSASLPYIDSVAARSRMSDMKGMALIHTGGFLLSCVMSLCLCAVFLRMLFVPVSDEAAGVQMLCRKLAFRALHCDFSAKLMFFVQINCKKQCDILIFCG